MRDKFRGWYRPTKEEFEQLWNTCLFAVDTSVLLSLYHYSPAASKAILDVLRTVNERLWIPHQAAKEYHENRIDVIEREAKKYAETKKQIQELLIPIKSTTQHPYLSSNLLNELEQSIGRVEAELNELRGKLVEQIRNDPLLMAVTDLFNGKTGERFDSNRLSSIFKSGETRYAKRIPPGYEDRKKDGDAKYGDLVVWFELIEKAKLDSRPIIFITNDSKCDWWLIRNGDTLGPCPELIEEFSQESGQGFYAYHSENFLTHAESYLNQRVDDKVIEEVRSIRVSDEQEKSRWQDESTLRDYTRVLGDVGRSTLSDAITDAERFRSQFERSSMAKFIAEAERQRSLIERGSLSGSMADAERLRSQFERGSVSSALDEAERQRALLERGSISSALAEAERHRALLERGSISGAVTEAERHRALLERGSVSSALAEAERHRALLERGSISGAVTEAERHRALLERGSISGAVTEAERHRAISKQGSVTGEIPPDSTKAEELKIDKDQSSTCPPGASVD